MARKHENRYGEKDADPDTDRSLFARIVESVIVLFICALLVKIGISYIVSVRVPLIIISVIILIAYIAIRVYRMRRHDDC